MSISNNMEKELIKHYVYDAWQFITNTEKTIKTAEFCSTLISKLINQMICEHNEWKTDLLNRLFLQDTFEKHIVVSSDDLSDYNLNILDINISQPFLIDKSIKDFFQYIRNSFDCMSQIVNSSLFANKSKKRDTVDFTRIFNEMNKQSYSDNFPEIQSWYNNINSDDIFQYIVAFNNRTKHTCDVHINLAMSLLDNKHHSQLDAFYKSDNQRLEKDICDIIGKILNFTRTSFDNLLNIINLEIKKDLYVEWRFQQLNCYQQKLENDENGNLSVVFIKINTDTTNLPDEIRVLLINSKEELIWVKNCTIKNIFVQNVNREYIAKYNITSPEKIDSIFEYVVYKKDEKNPFYGFPEVWESFRNNKIFYKSNPYINLETVTNDNEFAVRTQLPI